MGNPVYRKLIHVDLTAEYEYSFSGDYYIPHGIEGFYRTVECSTTADGWSTLPYTSNGTINMIVQDVDDTYICLEINGGLTGSGDFLFNLKYTKC